MLQVAVCDDDEALRIYLTNLTEHCLKCNITSFQSGIELLADKRKFDIILMDIGIGEPNGIETSRQLRKTSDAVIIFVTALKEFVFEAFDVEAFHYLVKPIDENKFKNILKRAVNEKCAVKEPDPLIIRVNGVYTNIRISNILYAENAARKIILYLTEGQLSYYAKMEDLETTLGKQFFRCHRGYLVNLKAVKSYDTGNIVLKNNQEIIMAKQKYNSFVSAYMDFLRRK